MHNKCLVIFLLIIFFIPFYTYNPIALSQTPDDKLLFSDNFDNSTNWDLNRCYLFDNGGDNCILFNKTSGNAALLAYTPFNFTIKFRFKSTGSSICCKIRGNRSIYYGCVLFNKGVYVLKDDGKNDRYNLPAIYSDRFVFSGNWQNVEISASGNIITIFVDGVKVLECIDNDQPIESGGELNFNYMEVNPPEIYLDDVSIWGNQGASMAPMPTVYTPVTPLPSTLPAPSPSATTMPSPLNNSTVGQNENPSGIQLMYILGAGMLLFVGITGTYIVVRNSRSKVKAPSDTPVPSNDVKTIDNDTSVDNQKAQIPRPNDIDVFISYSSKDKSVADAVCHGMEAHNIKCWIAPRDVLVGQPFEASIINAIEHCRVMVMIFSDHTNHSPHVENEIRVAWKKGIPIIPFRLQDVPFNQVIDYYVGTHHWLDGMTEPLELSIDQLVQKVENLLAGGNGSSK